MNASFALAQWKNNDSAYAKFFIGSKTLIPKSVEPNVSFSLRMYSFWFLAHTVSREVIQADPDKTFTVNR